MEILDRKYIAFPMKRKLFIAVIGLCWLIIAIIAYLSRLISLYGGLVLLLIGALFVEQIKLNYRLEDLERKKKK